MMHTSHTLLAAVATLLLLASTGQANDWTRFRGPNGTGVAESARFPHEWSDADYSWKVEVPGEGHSHPVGWEGKLFLTTAIEEGVDRQVLCLDAATGETLWTKSYRSNSHRKHGFNSFASSTPTVDADRVYVVFNTFEENLLIALDHDGKELWRVDLGPVVSQHSLGASPILYQDMVILPNELDEGAESFVLAVDRKTGQTRWKTPRRVARTAYSTPMILDLPNGSTQLICNSQAHGVSGLDPKTGEMLWDAPLLDKRSCSSPIYVGGILTGTCGSGGGGNYLIAVRPGGELAYQLKGSSTMPYVPTPIAKGDLMFLISDKGIATCIHAPTGERRWQERIRGTFFGSPVRTSDAIYVMSRDAECLVLAASDQFELLARNELPEGSHSTPAIVGNRMYLRTFGHLLCLEGESVTAESE